MQSPLWASKARGWGGGAGCRRLLAPQASLLPLLDPGTSPLKGLWALPSVTPSLLPESTGHSLAPLIYLFLPGVLGMEPSLVAVWLFIIKDTVLRLGSEGGGI